MGSDALQGPQDSSAISPRRPPVVVLTGERGAGKTSSCRSIARLAASRGWDVAGVISPASFREGQKVGINVLDLRTGRERPLAFVGGESGSAYCCYSFDEGAFAWANGVLESSLPCDLLIVDELGPLEIELGKGFVSAFDVLRRERYRLAVVVVRPALVGQFEARLGLPCSVLRVEPASSGETPDPDRFPVPWFEEYLTSRSVPRPGVPRRPRPGRL